MRVIVLGGTRFVGRALVADLAAAGHEVMVVHRGRHETGPEPAVRHLHVDRRRLADGRDELAAFGADAVADLSALTAADAAVALDVVAALAPRLLVVSSVDVHRAWTSLHTGVCTDAVPLTESSPLRTGAPPERDAPAPSGWDVDMAAYDKLAVERAYLEHGAVVCRLPMVYGEHDAQRREEPVLRRVRAGRRRMPVGPGTLLVSRGYAPELARGLRLALEADADVAGEVFLLAESTCASMRLWFDQIVRASGAGLELVGVPESVLPADVGLTAHHAQHVLVDPAKAERRLGWVHAPAESLVARSVAWHLAHPPDDTDTTVDFTADDAALLSVGG